jgi:membrane protein
MKKVKEKIHHLWMEQLRFQLRTAWDILWEARSSFSRDGCLNLSAALAFYTILSIIPFLFILVSLTGYLLGSSEQAFQVAISFGDRLFPQSSDLIIKEVQALTHRAKLFGWVGFFSLIWTASIVFSSLEFALSIVFRVERRRSFVQSKLLAISMIPAAMIIFFFSLFITGFARIMENYELTFWGMNLAKSNFLEFLVGYLLPYLILTISFTAIYKVIPPAQISFRHALAGGASCAFLFEIVKHLFTWYVKSSSPYSIVYGSLETIIILVVWVFYSAAVLLFCAELVSAYRRRDITLLQKVFL